MITHETRKHARIDPVALEGTRAAVDQQHSRTLPLVHIANADTIAVEEAVRRERGLLREHNYVCEPGYPYE